jgi:hypothetical protein
VTGLNEVREVLSYHRMVFETPALAARVLSYSATEEARLAEALGGDLAARLTAGQIVTVQRILARENRHQLTMGRTAAEVYPEAVTNAEEGFRQLSRIKSD